MKKNSNDNNPRSGILNILPGIVIFFLVLLAACAGKDTTHEHDTYTCPMHPTVVSDRPATCPVCGMDLVRKARPGEEVEITEELARLIKSPNETVTASVKTVRGQYKSVPAFVEAQGIVTYDTRKLYTIPSRVGGRLEKVYLKYAFQPVARGQKIADIYSPELITAQRELLFLLKNDPGNEPLIGAAKSKLELLGLTPGQISDLVQRDEVSSTFRVYSPYNGYVIIDQQTPPASAALPVPSGSGGGGMNDGMNGSSSQPASAVSPSSAGPASTLLREGDYISAGQTLVSVVDNSALRIELDLPAAESTSINVGDKLDFTIGGRRKTTASVDFVQPFFNEGQNFVKLRVITRDVRDLHIGHLVQAKILRAPVESLWVPKEALLDLGTEKVVFIKDRGTFKAKRVTTGITAEGQTEIKGGLASSDEIAANAQYLVDSESFIKTMK